MHPVEVTTDTSGLPKTQTLLGSLADYFQQVSWLESLIAAKASTSLSRMSAKQGLTLMTGNT